MNPIHRIFGGCGAALLLTVQAGCGSPDDDAPNRWSGSWNYDLPDDADGTNIATVTCPDSPSLVVPQIGSITFELDGRDRLVGATDQGCSWMFAVDGDRAVFDPPEQSCFNEVIGSSYTIAWSIEIGGDHARETVHGTSHQGATDCAFDLDDGRRTRVDPGDTFDAAELFVGSWDYDPPDPATGGNIVQSVCGEDVEYAAKIGSLEIARVDRGQITAQTSEGCAFTFEAVGNTAQLSPPEQRCVTNDGQEQVARFWALASDGQRAHEFSSTLLGTGTDACVALLATGRLHDRGGR